MRKLISLLLVTCMVFTLCACGSAPQGMSKETYKLGKQAIKVMDQYLAGKISDDEAFDKLDEIYELSDSELDRIRNERDSLKKGSDDYSELAIEATTSGYVPFYISCFQMGIYEIPNSYGVYYDCQEIRDTLYGNLNGE